MGNRLKDYFNFTNSERKGTVALIIILLVVLSLYWFKDFFVTRSSVEVESLNIEVRKLIDLEKKENQDNVDIKVEYFKFNPNEIDQESWQKLGFSEKQALSILKYREKGAYFYKKEDLKRLYVVDDSIYNLLEPYIVIKNKTKTYYSKEKCFYVEIIADTVPIYNQFSEIEKVVCNKENGVYTYYSGGYVEKLDAVSAQENIRQKGFENTKVLSFSCNFGFKINIEKSKSTFVNKLNEYDKTNSLKYKFSNLKVYVNTADTTMFKSLKGIGSYYASKIINYRKSLGGFYSIDQLKEVYGISPEVIEQNLTRLILDTTEIQKININTCEIVELKRHPYINWNIANSIVQIRKNRDLYKSVEEIKKSDLVNAEIYRKIAPYLKTE